MKTICGADCGQCVFRENCRGCAQTNGRPFGGECLTAECYKAGGEACFLESKKKLMEEFNALGISDMPRLTELCPLSGAYVNLEYTLANGEKVRLLDDKKVYLGYQLEIPQSDRCYGLVADREHLLVCRYGCGGADPEIIVYKRR